LFFYDAFRRLTGIKSQETIATALKAVAARCFSLRAGGPSIWMIGEASGEERGAEKQPTMSPGDRFANDEKQPTINITGQHPRAHGQQNSSESEPNGRAHSQIVGPNGGAKVRLLDQSRVKKVRKGDGRFALKRPSI
jgi:hypothetical protein